MHTHLRLLKPALLTYDFPSSQQCVTEHKKKRRFMNKKVKLLFNTLLALPVNLYLTVGWKSTRSQNSRSDENWLGSNTQLGSN
jgi:hypothetical protein